MLTLKVDEKYYSRWLKLMKSTSLDEKYYSGWLGAGDCRPDNREKIPPQLPNRGWGFGLSLAKIKALTNPNSLSKTEIVAFQSGQRQKV